MSVLIKADTISGKIYLIRGHQVMLDRDLAELYGVETKVLNQAVKRNIARFPNAFRFQLDEEELVNLRSQIVTSREKSDLRSQSVTLNKQHGGRRYSPFVFTEQGVAMLSAVLRSKTAVNVSIQIMQAFVAMRRFMLSNAEMFQRLDSLEIRQLHTEKKVDAVLDAISMQDLVPKQGIFFDGQIFDAYAFASKLIRRAKDSIALIDNYIDDTVLTLLSKRRKDVSARVYTKSVSKQLQLDLEKHNAQYAPIEIVPFGDAHDRFLILDNRDIYHLGASLKDLGKKWFAFSKIESDTLAIIQKLKSHK
jgi:hypothetical protein